MTKTGGNKRNSQLQEYIQDRKKKVAEEEGFEPSKESHLAGFQDQCIKPDSATPPQE